MEFQLIIRSVAALVLWMQLALVVLISEGEDTARFIRSRGAIASPLSGTKIKQPWVDPLNYGQLLVDQPGRRYTPTDYDIMDENLKKLLAVGTCWTSGSDDLDYVPPLDGTDFGNRFCRDAYGMRFVLFDLQLLNVDAVDALTGSFTAQFQLVFHWREGWESDHTTWPSIYRGDPITSDNATLCGFYCDSTSKSTLCCDRGWVPPFQLPSCDINNVDSIMETPSSVTYYPVNSSFWNSTAGGYVPYDARRAWYVELDVTCPFTPDFHNFPYDYQFLTLDIVNPYASHTWLQLNRGFLQANIINSIGDIDLNPDLAIDGWRMKNVIVSSACGTQQTWAPALLTQDELLQFLGDGYKNQSKNITDLLNHLTSCAHIKDLSLEKNSNLGNPANYDPYTRTRDDYLARLNATIAEYKECTRSNKVEFQWNTSLPNDTSKLPFDKLAVNYIDPTFMKRSFSFLDNFQYLQAPPDGVNLECVINAIANLTTPGIRINIIVQRFKMYYLVKLILPTCACVAFSFAAFALHVDELLGRLTVVVPSAIALSALQGYVVTSDVPAVAYPAPTTYIIVISYGIQLLITLESIFVKYCRIFMNCCCGRKRIRQSKNSSPSSYDSTNEEQNTIVNQNEDPSAPMILLQTNVLQGRAQSTSSSIATDQVEMSCTQFIRQPALSSNHNHHHHQQQQQQRQRQQQQSSSYEPAPLPQQSDSSSADHAPWFKPRCSLDCWFLWAFLALYILSILLVIFVPLIKANSKLKQTKHQLGSYESLWNHYK